MTQDVVIAGGTEQEAWLHASAYAIRFSAVDPSPVPEEVTAGDDAKVDVGFVGLWTPGDPDGHRARMFALKHYATFDDVLIDPRATIVEMLLPFPERTRAAIDAIKTGKHLLLTPPFASSSDEARVLLDAARGAGVSVMCYEPWPFYPPFQKLATLVRRQVVGRIQCLRMRTVLAGAGGWDPFLNPTFPGDRKHGWPSPENLIRREAFEKLSLAVRLLGPIESLSMTGGPIDPTTGGARLLTFKHAAHATYGSLEIVLAPGMTIRSGHDPREDLLELTGTAGVLWLTRGPAQMRCEPVLRMYRGEHLFAYETLPDQWELGFQGCVRHFVQCIRKRRMLEQELEITRHVVQCLEVLQQDTMERYLPEQVEA